MQRADLQVRRRGHTLDQRPIAAAPAEVDEAPVGANADLGRRFVCTSFRPSWGISKRMGNAEAALLVLSADAALRDREVRLSPVNTWSPKARSYMDGGVDEDEALAQTLRNKAGGEVLVADSIPVEAVRGIIFASAAARDYWWPHFLEHSALPASHFDLGARVSGDGLKAFLFRPDHPSEVRVEARRRGENRRLVESQHEAAPVPLRPVAVEALTWDEVHDDWTDWDEDDPDERRERDLLRQELDAYTEDMAVLSDTGWLPDDNDEIDLYRR